MQLLPFNIAAKKKNKKPKNKQKKTEEKKLIIPELELADLS